MHKDFIAMTLLLLSFLALSPTEVRLKFPLPNQSAPVFGFEYPVKTFLDHDQSTLDVERIKVAGSIAVTLPRELLKVLKN